MRGELIQLQCGTVRGLEFVEVKQQIKRLLDEESSDLLDLPKRFPSLERLHLGAVAARIALDTIVELLVNAMPALHISIRSPDRELRRIRHDRVEVTA